MRRLAPALLAALAFAACGGDERRADRGATDFGVVGSPQPTAPTVAPERTPPSADEPSDEDGLSRERDPDPEPRQLPGESKPAVPVGRVPEKATSAADVRAVTKTVRTYLSAIADGNGGLACAQFTPKGLRDKLREIARVVPTSHGSPCSGAILLYQGAYGKALQNPRVTNVRVSGRSATVKGPAGTSGRLVKIGRLWLIDFYSE
jgi:hypothetical protein